MKRSKVVFVNKSKLILHAQCKRCGTSDLDIFEVVNRKILRVFPGQYEITVHYEGCLAMIDSKSIDNTDITEVSTPNHSKNTASQIVLNLSDRKVRIIFRDQISVGSILDGSANRDI